MNLINQMLSDLDQRQASNIGASTAGASTMDVNSAIDHDPASGMDSGNDSHISVPFNTAISQPKVPVLKIIFYIVSIFLLSTTSYFSYLIYTDNNNASQPQPVTSVNPPKKTVAAVSQQNTRPVQQYSEIAKSPVAATNKTKQLKPFPKKSKPATSSAKNSLAKTYLPASPAASNNAVQDNYANITQNNLNPQEDFDTNIGSVQKQSLALNSEQQAEVAYKKGYQLLQENKIYSAEAKLLLSLEHNVKHVKAREVLVGLYLKTGRQVEAEEILNKGLLHLPDYSNFKKLYARLLLDSNQVGRAIKVLLQNKPAISADLNYFALLAASYQRNKNHAAAAKTYVKLLKLKPREGIWWVGMAVSLEALNKNKEALDAYEKARQTGTLNTRISNYSSQRLKQLGIQSEP